MTLGRPSGRASFGLEIAIALLPIVVILGYAITLTRFTLIDDHFLLARSLTTGFWDNFELEPGGRFRPLYWLRYWMIVRLLAAEPCAFALGNGLFVLGSAVQVWWIARRAAGPLLAVAAAWLFTFSLPTIENVFTLGKGEPQQLAFWLAALLLLARLVAPTTRHWTLLDTLLLILIAGANVLSKETSLLLGFPLLFACGALLSERRGRPRADWHLRAVALASVLALVAVCGAVVALHSFSPGDFPVRVIAEDYSARPVIPLWGRDALTLVLIAMGLVGAAMALHRRTDHVLMTLLAIQFAAIVLFLTAIRTPMLYYYYPAVAMGAVLTAIAVADVSVRSRIANVAAPAILAVAIAYGAVQSVWASTALIAWNRMYEVLNRSVMTARPQRVIFRQSVGPEPPWLAKDFAWGPRGSIVAALDEPAYSLAPLVPTVSARELRRGDWIIERFGTNANRRVPFRDLDDASSIGQGLLSEGGRGLLPLRIVHDDRAVFAVPRTWLSPFPTDNAAIRWRIYEVVEAPPFLLENLESDYWMRDHAVLALRMAGVAKVRVRFSALGPKGRDNALFVYAGDRRLAECETARLGPNECIFVADSESTRPDELGWITLDLRPRRTFVPAKIGINADTRALSFNIDPATGSGVFIEPMWRRKEAPGRYPLASVPGSLVGSEHSR